MGKALKKRDVATRWNSVMQANYGAPTIQLERGKGITVWDVDGKRYLDMLGGIATNLLGHNHPKVTTAISVQARRLGHISNFYANEESLELAKRLQEKLDPSARVYFCNSGAEANEAALKISRLTGRKRVVAAIGAFHGRTMGALSLTGQPSKRNPYKPLLKGVKHVPYGNSAALKRTVNRRTSMLILEPIMGEAGVIVPPPGYLRAAREICDQTGALLIFEIGRAHV